MRYYQIKASHLSGSIRLPTSKSQTIRAIFFATMAQGRSKIANYLKSPDIKTMVAACQKVGAKITYSKDCIEVLGTAGKIITPDNVIDAGNSGQVLRFIACLAGLQSNHMVITGDKSIRYNRPVRPLIESFHTLGMTCLSLRDNDKAPLILKGPFIYDKTFLNGQDSQPVSGLLMTLPFYAKDTVIQVAHAGEHPWIDLTLSWLKKFNFAYNNINYERYELKGGQHLQGFNYTVPGDLSSLAYPLVAAIITRSEVTITKVDLSEPQGDKKLVSILQTMGAQIKYDANKKSIQVYPYKKLKGITVNVNDCIDCITILAVIGCYAKGTTVVTGGSIARLKESDRIHIMTQELQAMGADIKETADGFIIKESKLQGARINSYTDHRVVLSLAVAALGAVGKTTIVDVSCVNKSYPSFATEMAEIGMNIQEHSEDDA